MSQSNIVQILVQSYSNYLLARSSQRLVKISYLTLHRPHGLWDSIIHMKSLEDISWFQPRQHLNHSWFGSSFCAMNSICLIFSRFPSAKGDHSCEWVDLCLLTCSCYEVLFIANVCAYSLKKTMLYSIIISMKQMSESNDQLKIYKS